MDISWFILILGFELQSLKNSELNSETEVMSNPSRILTGIFWGFLLESSRFSGRKAFDIPNGMLLGFRLESFWIYGWISFGFPTGIYLTLSLKFSWNSDLELSEIPTEIFLRFQLGCFLRFPLVFLWVLFGIPSGLLQEFFTVFWKNKETMLLKELQSE